MSENKEIISADGAGMLTIPIPSLADVSREIEFESARRNQILEKIALKLLIELDIAGVVESMPRNIANGCKTVAIKTTTIHQYDIDDKPCSELVNKYDITDREVFDTFENLDQFKAIKKRLIESGLFRDISRDFQQFEWIYPLEFRFNPELLPHRKTSKFNALARWLPKFKKPGFLTKDDEEPAHELIARVEELSHNLQSQAIKLEIDDADRLHHAVKDVIKHFREGSLNRSNLRYMSWELSRTTINFEKFQRRDLTTPGDLNALRNLYEKAVIYAEGLVEDGVDVGELNTRIDAAITLAAPVKKVPN